MMRRNPCIVLRDGKPQRRTGRKRVRLMDGDPIVVFSNKRSARWAIWRTLKLEKRERFDFAPPPDAKWEIVSVEFAK